MNLILKLVLAIILGLLSGFYLPEVFIKIAVTISSNLSIFISFIIPFMILAFVTKGISDLKYGAGKLLIFTSLIAYISTILAGSLSYFMSNNIVKTIITDTMIENINKTSNIEIKEFFNIPLSPMIDVTSALVLAFILGLSISTIKVKNNKDTFYKLIDEFNDIIMLVLNKFIIPSLPFLIYGNFAKMAFTGSAISILSIFSKIFVCIILLHLLYILFMFIISGIYTKKNILLCLKNQVNPYFTAIGTQSSAATIPVNMEAAKKNGISNEIREFVIPLCATIHLPGSMITLITCIYTILILEGIDISFISIIKFIMILAFVMVAAPGTPGGGVMSALPFVYLVGIDSTSFLGTLLISLYIAQDSFGTAANVSGDNAIALIVDKFFREKITKK